MGSKYQTERYPSFITPIHAISPLPINQHLPYKAATTPSIPTTPPIAAISAGAPALLEVVLGVIPVNVPVPKTDGPVVVATAVVVVFPEVVVFVVLEIDEFLSEEEVVRIVELEVVVRTVLVVLSPVLLAVAE